MHCQTQIQLQKQIQIWCISLRWLSPAKQQHRWESSSFLKTHEFNSIFTIFTIHYSLFKKSTSRRIERSPFVWLNNHQSIVQSVMALTININKITIHKDIDMSTSIKSTSKFQYTRNKSTFPPFRYLGDFLFFPPFSSIFLFFFIFLFVEIH